MSRSRFARPLHYYFTFFRLWGGFYSRDATVVKEGRRCFVIFAGEVVAFLLADITRVKSGLPTGPLFGIIVAAATITKPVLIIRIFTVRKPA